MDKARNIRKFYSKNHHIKKVCFPRVIQKVALLIFDQKINIVFILQLLFFPFEWGFGVLGVTLVENPKSQKIFSNVRI